MAAEGEWPKVNGDVFYASEANNFYYGTASLTNQQLIQSLNILINSAAAASSIYGYEDMFVDVFADADGIDDTVDIGSTTATFSTNKYDNTLPTSVVDTFTRGDSATVGTTESGSLTWTEVETNGTSAIVSNELVVTRTGGAGSGCECYITWTATDKVERVDFKLKITDVSLGSAQSWTLLNSGTSITSIKSVGTSKLLYNDGADKTLVDPITDNTQYSISLRNINFTSHTFDIWVDDAELFTDVTFANNEDQLDKFLISLTNVNLAVNVDDVNIQYIEGGTPADLLVQTNAIPITADPVGHYVFAHYALAGSGSIDYDISFDNGVTWITNQPLNTQNTSVHTGSQMILKLNLNGVGSGNTSEALDYAIMLSY